MRKAVLTAVAALAVLLGPALAAHADHNRVDVTVSEGECGALTIDTAFQLETHQGGQSPPVLVVQAHGPQTVHAIGETADVPGSEDETATVRWRIWGGGERGFDDPALTDLAALVAYLGDNPGGELDVDAPGVAWHEVTVEGCVPEPEPTETPEPDPTDEPTTEPTSEPTAEPTSEPKTSTPAPVPTSVPAGAETLPDTGVAVPLLLGLGLAGGGAGLLGLRRRLSR